MIDTHKFSIGDKVVYSCYGVGEIENIKNEAISGSIKTCVYVISFERTRMKLTVPFANSSNIRPLMGKDDIEAVYKILSATCTSVRNFKTRKSQELEKKLKSGNLLLAAEVLRDLYKKYKNKEKSYSERILYESALNKVKSEIAAIEQQNESQVEQEILNILDREI